MSRFRPTLAVAVMVVLAGALSSCHTEDHWPVFDLDERRTLDWAAAGVNGGIPSPPVRADVVASGATAGDASDDDARAFQRAIDRAAGAGGGVVTVPPGTYRLAATLRLPTGVVLRGAGAGSTKLDFDGPLYQGILIGQDVSGEVGWVPVVGAPAKGTSTIGVADTSSFPVPGFAEIEMDTYAEEPPANNGWSVPPNPNSEAWRLRAPGQLVRVVSKTATTLTIEGELGLTFDDFQDPRVRPLDLTTNVGVEGLAITMSDDNRGRAIRIWHAGDVWVTDVETANVRASHIETYLVLGCELSGNYHHDATAYGNGGLGYGLNIGRHTTACRIENNVLANLRHATLFQMGANGNVYAYNYSTDSGHPEPDRADLSFHGHFSWGNLVEGNVVQQIYIADWWGRVGPWNTIVRNCIRPVRPGDSGDLRMSYDSDQTTILGNVFADHGSRIVADAGVDGVVAHANLVGGRRVDDRIIANSYYLGGRPSFFSADTGWPVAAADNGAGCTNEAADRGLRVANP